MTVFQGVHSSYFLENEVSRNSNGGSKNSVSSLSAAPYCGGGAMLLALTVRMLALRFLFSSSCNYL